MFKKGAGGAAPLGNQNAKKAKDFSNALKAVIAVRGGGSDKDAYFAGLEKLAGVLCDAAYDAKEPWAIQEIANRIDGKPAQAIIGGDEDDPALSVAVKGIIELVRPDVAVPRENGDSVPPSPI